MNTSRPPPDRVYIDPRPLSSLCASAIVIKTLTYLQTESMDVKANVLPSQEMLDEEGQFSDAESCTSYDTPPASGFRPFFAQENLPTVVVKPRVVRGESKPVEAESRHSSNSEELWDTAGPTYNPTIPGQFDDLDSEEAPSEFIVDITGGEEAQTSTVEPRTNTRKRVATWMSRCPKMTAGRAAVISALTTATVTSALFALILSGVEQTNTGCPSTNNILSGQTKVSAI